MAAKYHITMDGPKPCSAVKKPCPLQLKAEKKGETVEHYPTKQEAQKAYETKLEEEYNSLDNRKAREFFKGLANDNIEIVNLKKRSFRIKHVGTYSNFKFEDFNPGNNEAYGEFEVDNLSVHFEKNDFGTEYWIAPTDPEKAKQFEASHIYEGAGNEVAATQEAEVENLKQHFSDWVWNEELKPGGDIKFNDDMYS